MGNDFPTGESITFVHTDYGVLRSNVKLAKGIRSTKESNLQSLARLAYMLDKFKSENPNFTCPPKFIIANKSDYDDAIYYERRMDMITQHINVISPPTNECIDNVPPPPPIGTTSVPVLLVINTEDNTRVRRLRKYLAKKKRKEYYPKIMKLLEKLRDKGGD